MPTALYYFDNPDAPQPNRPTRFGSALIIMADGKVLLEHRKDNFTWGIVSGDLHTDETFAECACRKARQETGIHMVPGQLKEIKVFDDPSRIVSFLEGNIYRIVSYGFYADLFTAPETVCGDESLELRWADPMELDQYELLITHRDILEEFFRQKKIPCRMRSLRTLKRTKMAA